MAESTDEVALIILAALQAEQNRRPDDVRGRRPLGDFTKQLMEQHDWGEMDFLQGWGLIMSEKLAEVHPREGGFYANITEAGRAFMDEQQAKADRAFNKQPLFTSRQIVFIMFMVVLLVRVGILLWKAEN